MGTDLHCLYLIYKNDVTRLDDNHHRPQYFGYLAPKTKTEVSLHCTRTELFHVKKANVYVKIYCDEGRKTTKTEKNLDLGIES